MFGSTGGALGCAHTGCSERKRENQLQLWRPRIVRGVTSIKGIELLIEVERELIAMVMAMVMAWVKVEA